MKKVLSALTILALTMSIATASAKEDPKKASTKKEKACCVADSKEAKSGKMDCCKDGKAAKAAHKENCDPSKCADKPKAEKTTPKSDSKN